MRLPILYLPHYNRAAWGDLAYAHAGDVMAKNAVGVAAQDSFRAFLDKRKH